MYESMKCEITCLEEKIKNPKLRKMFDNCFYDTLKHAITYLPNGQVYILTGDIPAMWLRDSSGSVGQYIPFAKDDKDIKKMLLALLDRDYFYISIDPYANAFNKDPNGHGFTQDEGLRTPYTWERKFELDSLCYPIHLQYSLYKSLGDDKSILTDAFIKASQTVIDVFSKEQRHSELSDYYHYRPGEKEEFCIPNHGKGGKVNYTGMIWSGYRPSDDACHYGYFIPGNMFAVVALRELDEMLTSIGKNELAEKARELCKEVKHGIDKYGIVHTEEHGDIYAYETDGLGNYLLMDDPNVPSLLSMPVLTYSSSDDPIYKNTREACLSKTNPYYYKGKCLEGEGSPHTPSNYVWPMGLIMQASTSSSKEERERILKMLLDTDDGTCLMHEGIKNDDPKTYTRPWFTWCNSLLATFLLNNKDLI